MEVETCGESRKVVKSVLIFIYTPAITPSLASKFSQPRTQRIELPYSLSLSPLTLLPSSVPYLPYILFSLKDGEIIGWTPLGIIHDLWMG